MSRRIRTTLFVLRFLVQLQFPILIYIFFLFFLAKFPSTWYRVSSSFSCCFVYIQCRLHNGHPSRSFLSSMPSQKEHPQNDNNNSAGDFSLWLCARQSKLTRADRRRLLVTVRFVSVGRSVRESVPYRSVGMVEFLVNHKKKIIHIIYPRSPTNFMRNSYLLKDERFKKFVKWSIVYWKKRNLGKSWTITIKMYDSQRLLE